MESGGGGQKAIIVAAEKQEYYGNSKDSRVGKESGGVSSRKCL